MTSNISFLTLYSPTLDCGRISSVTGINTNDFNVTLYRYMIKMIFSVQFHSERFDQCDNKCAI